MKKNVIVMYMLYVTNINVMNIRDLFYSDDLLSFYHDHNSGRSKILGDRVILPKSITNSVNGKRKIFYE